MNSKKEKEKETKKDTQKKLPPKNEVTPKLPSEVAQCS